MKISWHFRKRLTPVAAPAVFTPRLGLSVDAVTTLVTDNALKADASHLRQIDFLSPLDHIRGRRRADFGDAGLLLALKRSRRRRTR